MVFIEITLVNGQERILDEPTPLHYIVQMIHSWLEEAPESSHQKEAAEGEAIESGLRADILASRVRRGPFSDFTSERT
jgi:hypothetical protein